MDRLKEIFDRQRSYLASLAPIYLNNGAHIHASVPSWPLNDRMAQEEFRLLAWRITEEVYEALQVMENSEGEDIDGFREEIADVLHFIIELAIVSGVTEKDIVFGPSSDLQIDDRDWLAVIFDTEFLKDNFSTSWVAIVEYLARSMMLLKQRPWRTDDRRTNLDIWKRSYYWFFRSFVRACINSNIEPDTLYEAFFDKAKINDRRQAEQKL